MGQKILRLLTGETFAFNIEMGQKLRLLLSARVTFALNIEMGRKLRPLLTGKKNRSQEMAL